MNKLYAFTLIVSMFFLSACSTRGVKNYSYKYKNNTKIVANKNFKPTEYSDNTNDHSDKMDKKSSSHPTMKPYVVMGRKYYPANVNVGDEFSGNASWYGPDFHGKLTSNGETYNMYDMTAAHKTLPMNTMVKVTNKNNGLSIVVRINDRGPFVDTRIIDLSNTAAKRIDMLGAGTAPVTIEILGFYVKGAAKGAKYSSKSITPGNYALQIASFSQFEGALATQEKHDNKDGYRTIIKDSQTDYGRVFKVLLKGFKSEEEAREYKHDSEFQRAFIVKED